jgi:predicted signal transduction protein with EAL and GGDEF domain
MTELMPGVTFSCGVAASAGGAAAIPLQVLWERADAALYVSKHDGRDRTTLYSSVSAGRPNADERRGEPHNDTHDG